MSNLNVADTPATGASVAPLPGVPLTPPAAMRALTLDATWSPRPGSPAGRDDGTSVRKALAANTAWRNPRLSCGGVPIPRVRRDEVLVRVRCCGVCGSDVHCAETDDDGYVRFSGPAAFPVVLGHEFAGEVAEAGADVRGLRPGDWVTAESVQWCGLCLPCRSGNPNQCASAELMGLSTPGAMATYVAVNQRYCWRLDALREAVGDGRAAEMAALVEPLGCAYNALFVAGGGMRPGAYVSIYGAGPIGLAALLLARAAGAAKVFVFDLSPPRNALAARFDADFTADPLELRRQGTSPAQVVRDLTGGHGADVQVEAAGSAADTVPQIERSLAPNGKMIYLGRAANGAAMNFDTLVTQANQVIGSRGHAGHGIFDNVIRLLATGRIPADRMITARYPLARAAEAVARAGTRVEGKVLVQC
jgi:threonine dehydrogenase-like Zn-dependent dehydrogenase